MKGHRFVKGNQTDFVKKKVERFRLGLPINCKTHGEHIKWRLHSDNNVQCLMCAAIWQMNQRRKEPLRFIYRDAKRHAISHKREFDIELSDLEELMIIQDKRCALTGAEFSNEVPPSLDRIDSSKGYIKGNIQLIQIKINIMKSNLSQDDFIYLCQEVANQNRKRNKDNRG